MDGFIQGAEAVRTVLVYIRLLYDFQQFSFAGPYGERTVLRRARSGPAGRHVIGHDKPGGRDVAFRDPARIITVNAAAVRAAAWPER